MNAKRIAPFLLIVAIVAAAAAALPGPSPVRELRAVAAEQPVLRAL